MQRRYVLRTRGPIPDDDESVKRPDKQPTPESTHPPQETQQTGLPDEQPPIL